MRSCSVHRLIMRVNAHIRAAFPERLRLFFRACGNLVPFEAKKGSFPHARARVRGCFVVACCYVNMAVSVLSLSGKPPTINTPYCIPGTGYYLLIDADDRPNLCVCVSFCFFNVSLPSSLSIPPRRGGARRTTGLASGRACVPAWLAT